MGMSTAGFRFLAKTLVENGISFSFLPKKLFSKEIEAVLASAMKNQRKA